jgi:methylglutamate dehydrogenase subunit C
VAADSFRTPQGGQIDRTWPLAFRFAGRSYTGYAGDTLASALLANGVRLMGRSFKYHRPRGLLSIGSEEPNALVTLRTGARREPNSRATMVELYDFLEADAQHAWPSLGFDIGAVNGWFAPLLTAGFYYKTFMGPLRSSWMWYEHAIRKAAGLGTASREPDPDTYEKMHGFADVVVIGGGPAGISAALAAAESGGRVMLIEEAPRLGGWLLRERYTIQDAPGVEWVVEAEARLAAMPNVTLLRRTTAFGVFDGGTLGAVERVSDHLREPRQEHAHSVIASHGPSNPPASTTLAGGLLRSARNDEGGGGAGAPRQRLWQIRAARIVLAAGSIEQPLVFGGNDRPGVMLAGAVRGYLNQYGVICGRRLAVVTDNDSGYRTALDYRANGLTVEAIIDRRRDPAGPLVEATRAAGIEIVPEGQIARTLYGRKLYGVEVVRPDASPRIINCDCLAMSGGWAPSVHLSSHLGGRPAFEAASGMFLPCAAANMDFAGACAGLFGLEDCLKSGWEAGLRAAQKADIPPCAVPAAAIPRAETAEPIRKGRKAFIDFQNDVTTRDVKLAAREGYVSVEHLKRYTTLGMGTDQGKTSNLAGLDFLSRAREMPVASIGATTFRPPFTPVALGALAGMERGQHFAPLRRTPMQSWHEAAGAPMGEAGLWRRPKAYPRDREDVATAGQWEALAVRRGVGIVDVSTLGKIEVKGPDAAAFLDRIYCNAVASLKPGRARYGVMLREDGMVLDDGTIARFGAGHFYITTTTAAAGKVMDHLERYAQVVWPELRVRLTSVTDQFGAIAVAGPKSRMLLERLGGDIDFSDKSLPYPAARIGVLGGMPARVLRVSYSGERAYEIHLPADYALACWEMLLAKGEDLGVTPYGTEAMGVLRIEKGHVAGAEIDGRTTPADLGLARMVRGEKEFVGKRMLERPALSVLVADDKRPLLSPSVADDKRPLVSPSVADDKRPLLSPLVADDKRPLLAASGRMALVGLIPADRNSRLRAGAQITADAGAATPVPMIGHITSACFSPHLGHPIALALVEGGGARAGETLYARFPLRNETVAVKVVSPVFVDPEGKKLHA